MAHRILHTGLLVLAWGCAAAAPAQSIYRCGNSYGEQPCGNAAPLPLHDPRSPAQQEQARASAARAAQEVARLEAERTTPRRVAEARRHPRNVPPELNHQPRKDRHAHTPPGTPPFIATVRKPKPAGHGENKGNGQRTTPTDGPAPAAGP